MSTRLPFTAAQLLAWLAAQVGVTESPANSNRTPYGKAVGLDGVAWCAILPAAGWQKLGASWRAWWGLPGTHWAYCPSLLAEGKRRGLAVSVEDVRAGDEVYLAFTAGNIARKFPEHIEHATGPMSSGHLVPTIGGNTSAGDGGSQANGGGVFRRVRPRAQIVGVIRPPYATPKAPAKAPAKTPAKAVTVPSIGRLLKLTAPNMHGLDVAAVQLRVGATRDGWFGPKTHRAVVAFQRRHKLAADGVVGRNTARALGLRWVG